MINHLDDITYLNCKGRTKCEKCSTEGEIEIRNDEVINAKKAQ
jgi:hypothetical protein